MAHRSLSAVLPALGWLASVAAPAPAQVDLSSAPLGADPVSVRVVPPAKPVRRGEAFRIEVRFEIAPPYHIYGPKEEKGDPTRVEAQPAAGLTFGAAEFPAPLEKNLPALGGSITLYEKAVGVFVPAVASAEAAPGEREIAVKVSYGACTDETCLRPVRGRAVSAKVEISDAPAAAPAAVLPGGGAAPAPAPPAGGPGAGGTPYGSFAAFLAACVGGGLLSLIMPCVYPLVPITLTYFMKQSGGSRRHGFALSGMYALGIVVAFTALGMILSLSLGARGAVAFAANPWVNLAIALVFLAFALSMFGLFEIALPGSVTNALAARPKQGLSGAFLLGLSFSVVTFTCTMPIASTLLGLAAGGSEFLAAAGMLAYSVTMAAPFLALGLFPALLGAFPRAGGWMETAKVTMGFLELQLVVYYLAKTDWGWEVGALRRGVILALWATLACFAAAHLFGLIRLRGRGEEGRPGPVRLASGAAAAALAVLLLAGLAGRPLGILEALLPPERGANAPDASGEAAWGSDFDAGLREAKASGRPLFAEFTGFT